MKLECLWAALGHRWALAGLLLLTLLGTGLLSGRTLRTPDRGPRDANWERIQSTGVLLIGVDPSIPPFGQDTGQTVIGLDPAIGREIAAHLGLEARFVLLGFDGLYDSLLVGEVDIVIAALRPDPLRLDRVRYTPPYFDAGQVLVSLQGHQDLAGLRSVGVEFASEGDLAARALPALQIERFFTAEEALIAVLEGQIEAALVDRVSYLVYRQAHPDSLLQVGPSSLVPDPYVIALRRNDWRLFQAVGAALEQMRADGRLGALHAEYLD
jgi:ABC-type amino acid transport substrate-binding protein